MCPWLPVVFPLCVVLLSQPKLRMLASDLWTSNIICSMMITINIRIITDPLLTRINSSFLVLSGRGSNQTQSRILLNLLSRRIFLSTTVLWSVRPGFCVCGHQLLKEQLLHHIRDVIVPQRSTPRDSVVRCPSAVQLKLCSVFKALVDFSRPANMCVFGSVVVVLLIYKTFLVLKKVSTRRATLAQCFSNRSFN